MSLRNSGEILALNFFCLSFELLILLQIPAYRKAAGIVQRVTVYIYVFKNEVFSEPFTS